MESDTESYEIYEYNGFSSDDDTNEIINNENDENIVENSNDEYISEDDEDDEFADEEIIDEDIEEALFFLKSEDYEFLYFNNDIYYTFQERPGEIIFDYFHHHDPNYTNKVPILETLKLYDIVVLKIGIKRLKSYSVYLEPFTITDIIRNDNNEIVSFRGVAKERGNMIYTEFSHSKYEFTKDHIWAIGVIDKNTKNEIPLPYNLDQYHNKNELDIIKKRGFVFISIDDIFNKKKSKDVLLNDTIEVLTRFDENDYRYVDFFVTEILRDENQLFRCKQINIVNCNSFDFGDKEYILSTKIMYDRTGNLKKGPKNLKTIIYDYKCRNNHRLSNTTQLFNYCKECSDGCNSTIGCYICDYYICDNCVHIYKSNKIVRNMLFKRLYEETLIRETELLMNLID
jgi:hypothetical protein